MKVVSRDRERSQIPFTRLKKDFYPFPPGLEKLLDIAFTSLTSEPSPPDYTHHRKRFHCCKLRSGRIRTVSLFCFVNVIKLSVLTEGTVSRRMCFIL